STTRLRARHSEQCMRSSLVEVKISFDSAIPEIYERIRVGSRFDRVARNVALLMETRKRMSGQQPRLKIVAVLMRQTLDGLPELVRMVHRWSIPELFVQHLCHDFAESSLPAEYRPMREFVDQQTLVGHDAEHIERVFHETRAVAEELGVQLRLPSCQPNPYPPG